MGLTDENIEDEWMLYGTNMVAEFTGIDAWHSMVNVVHYNVWNDNNNKIHDSQYD